MRVAILDLESLPRRRRLARPRGRHRPRARLRRDGTCGRRDRARARRGGLGDAAPARQRRRDRRAARRARRRGRAVRGRPARLARARRPRQRARCRRPLPGDRRRDGESRARLDRQRGLHLRPALARSGPLRLPPRGGGGVLQACRLRGLEVGARQPDALPRDLLGEAAAYASTRSLRTGSRTASPRRSSRPSPRARRSAG